MTEQETHDHVWNYVTEDYDDCVCGAERSVIGHRSTPGGPRYLIHQNPEELGTPHAVAARRAWLRDHKPAEENR